MPSLPLDRKVLLKIVLLSRNRAKMPNLLFELAVVLPAYILDEKPISMPTVLLLRSWFSTLTLVQLARMTSPAFGGIDPPTVFFM